LQCITAIFPAIFGTTLFLALGLLLFALKDTLWNSSGRFIELSIWPGEISGFKAGTDYSKLDLSTTAQIGPGEDLSGARFVDASLSGVTFDQVKLKGTDFTNAQLSVATFKDCDLSTTIFKSAGLAGTHFSGTKLIVTDQTFAESRIAVDPSTTDFLITAGAHNLRSQSVEGGMSESRDINLEKLDSSLADLIELELITDDKESLAKAKTYLDELRFSTSEKSVRRVEGQFLMLELMYLVLSGEPDTAAASRWKQWLDANSTDAMNWEWDTWNSNFKETSLTSTASTKLHLIKQLAGGEITTSVFAAKYPGLSKQSSGQ
jgi:hypothetical protein